MKGAFELTGKNSSDQRTVWEVIGGEERGKIGPKRLRWCVGD